jgi:hypothetical protein
MRVDIKKELILSQFSLIVPLLICSLIIPSVVVKNGGVSNFGNHLSTVFLYTLAFILCSYFLLVAAYKTAKTNKGMWYVPKLLIILVGLILLVLISTFPRHISWTYSNIHDYIGIALYSYEFFLSLWFVLTLKTSRLLVYLAIQAAGSIIGLLSILKIIHFLYVGQIIGGIGFALLLVYSLPNIVDIYFENKNTKTKKQIG